MPASVLLAAASVASLNLCTDEYLLLLARPGEIASVSYLAAEPLESPLWQQARRHHRNRGTIEQVVAQRPSAVLTMGGGGRSTSFVARRLAIKAVDLKPVSAPGDVAANLSAVAALLGDPKRADPWLARLRKLMTNTPRKALDTLWISSGGQSFTAGSAGVAWLRMAGLDQRQVPGGRVTLEIILARPPSVLVESRYRRRQVSLGTMWLDHPIVRNARSRRIATDGRAWTCLGPLMIGEVERLRRALR